VIRVAAAALLVSAAVPAVARAEVEQDTSAFVAGRPAVISSSTFVPAKGGACSAADLTELHATLTPPPWLTVADPLTLSLPVHGGTRSARWRVQAAQPGAGMGQVVWDGTSRGGADCRFSQDQQIVAAAGPPTLRVVGAARFKRGIAVVLQARVPGVGPLSSDFPSVFDSFFYERRDRAEFTGGGRGTTDLFFTRRHDEFTVQGDHFSRTGVACVDVGFERPHARLAYRIRFVWNHDIGARSIRKTGSVRVSSHPVTRAERNCASELSVDSDVGG
jgi:hypothetical protein